MGEEAASEKARKAMGWDMPLPRDEHCRRQAAQLRVLADTEDDPDLRADVLWLAEQYDELAKDAAKGADTTEIP